VHVHCAERGQLLAWLCDCNTTLYADVTARFLHFQQM
jgi:hypothetical protein